MIQCTSKMITILLIVGGQLSKLGLLLDGFYDPQNSEAFAFVKNWTNGNADGAKPGGIYSNKDIRFLGSHFIYLYT